MQNQQARPPEEAQIYAAINTAFGSWRETALDQFCAAIDLIEERYSTITGDHAGIRFNKQDTIITCPDGIEYHSRVDRLLDNVLHYMQENGPFDDQDQFLQSLRANLLDHHLPFTLAPTETQEIKKTWPYTKILRPHTDNKQEWGEDTSHRFSGLVHAINHLAHLNGDRARIWHNIPDPDEFPVPGEPWIQVFAADQATLNANRDVLRLFLQGQNNKKIIKTARGENGKSLIEIIDRAYNTALSQTGSATHSKPHLTHSTPNNGDQHLQGETQNGQDTSVNGTTPAALAPHLNGASNGTSSEGQASYGVAPIISKRKQIEPRTENQAGYIQALRDSELIFGLGPAGTGKTFLAAAAGVEMLLNGTVDRLILSRPAVEAGEKLGFLPGGLDEKVDPYLRPLQDALHELLPGQDVTEMMQSGEIEVAPLAFMRGRTLSNAFIILDEAQNTTPDQMKMFLTRLGEGGRMAITGDPSQPDLPDGVKSGLVDATELLKGEEGISFTHFADEDVVRHALVARIAKAYETRDAERSRRAEETQPQARGPGGMG